MFNSKVPYVTIRTSELQLFEVNIYKIIALIFFFILDAVETKFGLSSAELATVWEPMLESIKSKRRNIKAKIRKSVIKPSTLFFYIYYKICFITVVSFR